MEVNVEKLQAKVNQYKKKIRDYESCMQNLYNDFNQTSIYWKGSYCDRFLDSISAEKKDIFNVISDLNAIGDIYDFIIQKYSAFGQRIKYDLNKVSDINMAFDQLLSGLDDVIRKYDNLNLDFYPSERGLILQERAKLQYVRQDIQSLKEKINGKFAKIAEIETAVSSKISNIDIEFISEKDGSNFVQGGL